MWRIVRMRGREREGGDEKRTVKRMDGWESAGCDEPNWLSE